MIKPDHIVNKDLAGQNTFDPKKILFGNRGSKSRSIKKRLSEFRPPPHQLAKSGFAPFSPSQFTE
jgi:hypothetical protein